MSEPKVTRLPVQHKQSPHCPSCKADLPNLNSMSVIMGPENGDFEVLALMFHIRCACGARWDLRKDVKG
jgi:hypothetical protein